MRAASPKILILAVYFGPFPAHFALWLESCRRNPKFDWLLLTDHEPNGYRLPANVRWRHMSLQRAASIISERLDAPVRVETAQKICDFRPAFWTLLEGGECDCAFWGHCELDVIFGQLADFVTPFVLTHFDKIFTLGHLTLYRNRPFGNLRFQEPHPRVDWREIFGDPHPCGFDKENGVGVIWRQWPTRLYDDESLVANIDPELSHFERSPPYHNDRAQLFLFDQGRVFRLWWRAGVEQREEFAYIHFPRRKSLRVDTPAACDHYLIGPQGFIPCRPDELGPDIAQKINPWRPSWRDAGHRLRRHARALWRGASTPRDLGFFAK